MAPAEINASGGKAQWWDPTSGSTAADSSLNASSQPHSSYLSFLPHPQGVSCFDGLTGHKHATSSPFHHDLTPEQELWGNVHQAQPLRKPLLYKQPHCIFPGRKIPKTESSYRTANWNQVLEGTSVGSKTSPPICYGIPKKSYRAHNCQKSVSRKFVQEVWIKR